MLPPKEAKCGKWSHKCGKGCWIIQQRKQRAKDQNDSSLKIMFLVHWSLISSYEAWLWPLGIHSGHVRNDWGKSVPFNQKLAKLCELQKYKLARNINQRRAFTCPYVVWNILMNPFLCYNCLHNDLLSQKILTMKSLLYTYKINPSWEFTPGEFFSLC